MDLDVILELFAGAGGLAEALRQLGLHRSAVGIELDPTACATRRAAGHATIETDVTTFPADQFAAVVGSVAGICGGPVCITFSAAGSQAGRRLMAELAGLTRDMFAGRPTRATHRRAMAQVLQGSNWPPPRTRPSKHNRGYRVPARLTRAERSPVIRKAVVSASLVAEPARYIRACHPEWVVLEQVPAVLPLWEVYATELCALGYCTWCGVLNAADYGVPQSRPRAFLIASRVRAVQRPIATHYDPRKGDQLFGEPWISMADALGWGATDRPSPVVTAGGTAAGGPESFGHRSRELLEQARDAGHWVFRRPATTIQGDPRVSRPGHRDRDRGGESQFAVDSVRVTPEEAAALQGFRPGYPFQGARGKIYEQVGNAIPVQLATHAVAEATGMPIPAETARAA